MAERTKSSRTLSRGETADYLHGLASSLDGEGPATVSVGNKTVTLHPSESIGCDVEVVERSTLLGGNRERVEIELTWKPGEGEE